ncbi:helix-turn-helix domain-containing protein [Streptomyces sp. NPDC057460]|uniref:helix-turn-helix domain-containing protein n=1 Tax=Streptomyces sp. NPDC057460 TaxID=3346141 RepID=UPI0036CB22D5
MEQAAQLLRLARVRAAVNSGEARQLREAAHLSIGEVARACGVDQSTVWRWERGARKPRGNGALAYGELIDSLRSRLRPAVEFQRSLGLLPENSETPGAATPEASGERINKSTAK